jgi:hypothetical protein
VRVLLCLLLWLAGCTTVPEEPEPSVLAVLVAESLALDVATSGRGGLNVNIRVFESDQTTPGSIYLAAAQVRSVEQRYLPYVLKTTLDRSGHWGAVRVVPRNDPSAEILVVGRVVVSTGVELKLHLRVVDATGRVWIDQVYHDVADDIDYATDPNFVIDPFRDLYHRVANDMAVVASQLNEQDHEEIVNTATVRYGQLLSSQAFNRYLIPDGQRVRLTGLPAADDPLYLGVQKIRESEYLFTDSVDAYYESLYRTLGPIYAWWRYYSFELVMGNERLAGIDATRGATRGSWYAMERTYKTFKEAKMNQDALRELSESFDRETAPTTTEIAGRVVRLNGTIDTQYEAWRRILAEMYDEEFNPER